MYLTVLCLFIVTTLSSQIEREIVNESPYNAVYNHLYYLQNDSYEPERAALSLNSTPDDKTIQQSIKLKKILDGKGFFVDLSKVPVDSMYVDSLSQSRIYYISRKDRKIYLERTQNGWNYSRTTIAEIDKIYKSLYPLNGQLQTYFHAPFWQVPIVGISLWKWLGLFTMLIVGIIVYYIAYRIMNTFIHILLKSRIHIDDVIEKSIVQSAKVIGFLISIRLILAYLPIFQIPVKFNAGIIKSLNIASIVFLTLIVKYIADIVFVFFKKVTDKTDGTMDDQLLPILQKVGVMIIWAFGIFYIMDYLDVNITALVAGISIGGLALALAAQDTVKNFFGSIVIFIDKPFQVGDWIQIGEIDGTVEEIGVRSSRIRTFANSLIYVPNGKVADSVINNMGLRVYRRFNTHIKITYDTPPHRIEAFVQGIREIIKLHPVTRKDYYEVHLNELGESSIKILLYMFFKASSWTDELKAKHQVIYAIIKLADELKIDFAFPTQTIKIAKDDKKTEVKETDTSEELRSVLSDIDKFFKVDETDQDKFKPIGGG